MDCFVVASILNIKRNFSLIFTGIIVSEVTKKLVDYPFENWRAATSHLHSVNGPEQRKDCYYEAKLSQHVFTRKMIVVCNFNSLIKYLVPGVFVFEHWSSLSVDSEWAIFTE